MVTAPHSKTTPLVSVCLSTSAWKDNINEAIDSVLLQTYWNWELIIIRDYQDEQLNQQLTAYLDRYSDRIRVKDLEPTLPYEQAITCLSLVKGSYMATLKQRHTMQPNQLSYAVAFLKCYPGNEGVIIPKEAGRTSRDRDIEHLAPDLRGILNLEETFRIGEVLHGPSILARTKSVADRLPALVSEAYATESSANEMHMASA